MDVVEKEDMVNEPPHYKKGKMQAGTRDFLTTWSGTFLSIFCGTGSRENQWRI